MIEHALRQASSFITQADGLLICAGAGMGVDSGLPDFRGPEGFWRAYPALKNTGLRFEEMAMPDHFHRQAELAWGFYGHRLGLYRQTQPHAGFHILKRIAASLHHGAFVFTSNVDGQFQQAGFHEQQILECHGSVHYLQCLATCGEPIWPADSFIPEVDAQRCLLLNSPPLCPQCGALARPNVLMFNDWDWLEERSEQQHRNLQQWLGHCERPVIIELGAGTAVPTVRYFSERLGLDLIRVNLRESAVPERANCVALPERALTALQMLEGRLAERGFFTQD